MKDPLLDAFKMALGAADLTREEAEKLVEKLQEKYKDDIVDGRAMVDELLKQSEENSKKLKARIEREVARAINEQRLVKEKDLKSVIAHLEQAAVLSARIAKRAGKDIVKRARKRASSVKKSAAPKGKKTAREASPRKNRKKKR